MISACRMWRPSASDPLQALYGSVPENQRPQAQGQDWQAPSGHRRSSWLREAVGRSKGDAPEIDGKVHVASRRPLRRATSSL